MIDDVYFSFFELKVSKIDKSGQFIWVLIRAAWAAQRFYYPSTWSNLTLSGPHNITSILQ